MKMSRATGSDSFDTLIEIAKDPEAFSARVTELRDIEAAAKKASDEAITKKTALNQFEGELNLRAARLTRDEEILAANSAALAKAREEFANMTGAYLAEHSATTRALNTRENDIAARTAAVEEAERGVRISMRQAKEDRDGAAALLLRVNGIIAGLENVKAQISAIGAG